MIEESIIHKRCTCGAMMTIHMHTLIYQRKLQIAEVPVYSCARCGVYEPMPMIRQELAVLLAELGDKSRAGSMSFADRSEWAAILRDTITSSGYVDASGLDAAIREAVQSRIDLLLDVYRFAASSGEREWTDEIGRRLTSLSAVSLK